MPNPLILIIIKRVKEGKGAIEKLNIPFKHFETTKVGYIRKEKFS